MVRPQSASGLIEDRKKEWVSPSILGRNNNVDRRKRPVSEELRAGESLKAHPQYLLLPIVIFVFMSFVVLCLFALNSCYKIPNFLPLSKRFLLGKGCQYRHCILFGLDPLSDPEAISLGTTQGQQDLRVTQLESTENLLPTNIAGPSSKDSIHLTFFPEGTQMLNECWSNSFWQ